MGYALRKLRSTCTRSLWHSKEASLMPKQVKQARKSTSASRTRPSISAPYAKLPSPPPKQDLHARISQPVAAREKQKPLRGSSAANTTGSPTERLVHGVKRKPPPDLAEVAEHDPDLRIIHDAGRIAQANRRSKRARIDSGNIASPASTCSKSPLITASPGTRKSKRLSDATLRAAIPLSHLASASASTGVSTVGPLRNNSLRRSARAPKDVHL